jgi:hypothetical protein
MRDREIHAHRRPPCPRCKRGRCGYLAADDAEALGRLVRRGPLDALFGVWTARR